MFSTAMRMRERPARSVIATAGGAATANRSEWASGLQPTISYGDRYFAGIGLSAVSASQKIVTIHQRTPS